MADRKPLTKTIRFEVFKRDKFTCQYCGRMSPDVILEVDHIKPVAEGGNNDMLNLITSCRDCNRGKGKRKLSDDAELKKQQKRLKDLAERKEQIEFMAQFRKDLLEFKKQQVEDVCDYWSELTDNEYFLNKNGQLDVKKLLDQFKVDEIYVAMDIAIKQYYNGTKESVEKAFGKVGGIYYNRRTYGNL